MEWNEIFTQVIVSKYHQSIITLKYSQGCRARYVTKSLSMKSSWKKTQMCYQNYPT
jgi:hypothetical protein